MKGKLIWLIIALAIIATIFSVADKKSIDGGDFKPLELNVGEEFTYIDYGEKMYVLNYLIQDVTGDNTKDMIILIGQKENVEEPKAINIDVVIYEPNESKFYNMKLKKFEGEMPKIEIVDLTGDGILDIVLKVEDENGNCIYR